MFGRSMRSQFYLILTLFILLGYSAPAVYGQKTSFGKKEEVVIKKIAIYTAVVGDTPFSVAKKFNLTIAILLGENPLIKTGINPGDELVITGPFFYTASAKPTSFLKYKVGRKETLYAISKLFNTTQDAIVRLNPEVKGVLSSGITLTVPGPDSDVPSESVEPSASNKSLQEYTIISGDNFYQLEQRFGVLQAELEQLNPSLKSGFKLGMVIQIPAAKFLPEKSEKQKSRPEIAEQTKGETPFLTKNFEIGIFLPFGQNQPDSIRLAQHSNNYLEFYSGVLLAAQKLTASGMKLKFYVYDTNGGNEGVNKVVTKPEFLGLDLVIGPVFPEDQKVVAELCFKNHIPMVSPLSSDNHLVNVTPGFYVINSGRKQRLSSTADYIAASLAHQNLIFLNHTSRSQDEKFLYDRLIQKLGSTKMHQFNILSDELLSVEKMLKENVDNVFILADDNEANVSIAITRLNTLSKTHKLKVIGLQEYIKMQSVDIEYFHNVNLQYLSPYYVDYNDTKTTSFLEAYRQSFDGEPSQYSFQGYDIGWYFIKSLARFGKQFSSSNPIKEIDLLQSTYNFQKASDFGGYVNRMLYVIEYADNYDVKCVGKIQE
jgi:LysM repeat protein/ABC-type branched-subunit amino acid transport system substrate-binding protein